MVAPDKSRQALWFGNHTQLVGVDLGTPALADVDFYIASVAAAAKVFTQTDMANVALADSEPARTVTLTVTEAGTLEDTVTSIVIIGYDQFGVERREVIDASTWDDTIVFETAFAYSSLQSVELVGWVQGGGSDDTFTVGFGDNLGLGVQVTDNRNVFMATLGGTVVAHDAVVTGDADYAAKCLIDLSGDTYNGSKVARVFLNP